jgi:hypothetical protein
MIDPAQKNYYWAGKHGAKLFGRISNMAERKAHL